MRLWTGCMSTLVKFYGELATSVIVFISSLMVVCVQSPKIIKAGSKLLQNTAKGIPLARSMSSQVLLGAIQCMLFEIQSSYVCHRPSSMPYPHGRFSHIPNRAAD